MLEPGWMVVMMKKVKLYEVCVLHNWKKIVKQLGYSNGIQECFLSEESYLSRRSVHTYIHM